MERSAYCRIDQFGDIEDVIKLFDIPSDEFGELIIVATIESRSLYEYAGLAGMGLIFYFDFTRFLPGSFGGWSNQERFDHSNSQLLYRGGVQRGVGSYVNGRQIVFPPLTKRQIVRLYKERRDPKNRQYATFKALDLKKRKHIEVTCNPAKLSNYFQPQSKFPLGTSPAFFRSEVLHKYKSDPSKYELDDRSISCRGTWHLKTYDVNDADQIHTYLCYLADLPHQEQLYWQSFNEWPKAFISERAWKTDFLGEFSIEYDLLIEIKRKVAQLDKLLPVWWKKRGKELINAVRYPVTSSPAEWAEAILGLDHLITEGFQEAPLRKMAIALERKPHKDWRSLMLLREYLAGKGLTEEAADTAVSSLRELHGLRSILKGHSAPRQKAEAEKKALTTAGSFRAHFEQLAADCDSALDLILAHLGVVDDR